MDCRDLEFSPEKAQERINRALQVFPRRVLMRVLAFALHLLGARRSAVAAMVQLPEESLKTVLRLVFRDGFAALRDRRCSDVVPVARATPSPSAITVRRASDGRIVDFGPNARLEIPLAHTIQARAVLLSLLNAGLLGVPETASVLGMSAAHCRELARKLVSHDVVDALVDKRQGQKRDYRVGPEQKAEIIQQVAARIVTGHSTSSEVVAERVNERTRARLSARTVRWHLHHLGLANLNNTLPQLVESLKKTPNAGS